MNQEKQDGKLKETAFIARTNEPLVHAALQMLRQKIPFVILGKDIANDLKKHIQKITNLSRLDDMSSVEELERKITEYLNNEKETHYGSSTKKAYLQELEESSNAILSSIQQFMDENRIGRKTIQDFKIWLNERLGGLNIEDNEKDLKKFKDTPIIAAKPDIVSVRALDKNESKIEINAILSFFV